jgi:hypothetical protein
MTYNLTPEQVVCAAGRSLATDVGTGAPTRVPSVSVMERASLDQESRTSARPWT